MVHFCSICGNRNIDEFPIEIHGKTPNIGYFFKNLIRCGTLNPMTAVPF